MVQECLDVWLTTEGEEGRHERRVKEIDDYPAVGATTGTGAKR
jgi:hypothetical protein